MPMHHSGLSLWGEAGRDGMEGLGFCPLPTTTPTYCPNLKPKPNHDVPWGRGYLFYKLTFYLLMSARMFFGGFVAICSE